MAARSDIARIRRTICARNLPYSERRDSNVGGAVRLPGGPRERRSLGGDGSGCLLGETTLPNSDRLDRFQLELPEFAQNNVSGPVVFIVIKDMTAVSQDDA